MGELGAADDIADRVDFLVSGAQVFVDHDAFRVVADTGGVEIEIVNVRAPPGCEQKMRSFDRFFAGGRIVGLHYDDLDAREHAAHLRDLHAGAQPHALAGKCIEHNGRTLAVFARERHGGFEHGDVGAEPAKGLRQFETGPARADDNQMARTIGEIEHCFRGEVRRLGQTWNCRDYRG